MQQLNCHISQHWSILIFTSYNIATSQFSCCAALHHHTIALLHHCTIALLLCHSVTLLHHSHTLTPFSHSCTITPSHHCTIAPLHHYTLAPLCTASQFSHCAALHHCTIVASSHSCTLVHSISILTLCSIAPSHHHTLAPLHYCTITLSLCHTIAPFLHPCTILTLLHHCTIKLLHHHTIAPPNNHLYWSAFASEFTLQQCHLIPNTHVPFVKSHRFTMPGIFGISVKCWKNSDSIKKPKYAASVMKKTSMLTFITKIHHASSFKSFFRNLRWPLKTIKHLRKQNKVEPLLSIHSFFVTNLFISMIAASESSHTPRSSTATLFKILEHIQSFQSTDNFPQCELGNLQLLSSKWIFSWDESALLDPSKCWDPQFDSESADIFHTLSVTAYSEGTGFEVLQNGNFVGNNAKRPYPPHFIRPLFLPLQGSTMYIH